MELREDIEYINNKLKLEFGSEADGRARFRVVFSDDEYEKRWTEYTEEGFLLAQPEVREFPKYKQWIHQKYILERLVPIPDNADLTEKVGYEPCWVFQTKNQEYLPPFFDGCRLVIESMYSAIGRKDTFARYKDKNISKEEHLAHIQKVEQELFGNESAVTDALAYKTGVTVPEMPKERIH
jgi:hypothetical protein